MIFHWVFVFFALMIFLSIGAIVGAGSIFGDVEIDAEDDEIAREVMSEAEIEELHQSALSNQNFNGDGFAASETPREIGEISDNDEFWGTGDHEYVAFGSSADTDPENAQAPLWGAGGDDILIGNNFANTLFGGVGDDILIGNGESGDGDGDRLDGDAGNDTLIGGNGDDVLIGGLGQDVISGGAGNDEILDGYFQDVGHGDVIYAGEGDDIIRIHDGYDFVSTGDGNDLVAMDAKFRDEFGSLISDFDPAVDRLELTAYAEGLLLSNGQDSIDIPIKTSSVETQFGTATLVEIDLEHPSIADFVSDLTVNKPLVALVGVSAVELNEMNTSAKLFAA